MISLFPEIGGPFGGCPYTKSPTIWGPCSEALDQGLYIALTGVALRRGTRCPSGRPAEREGGRPPSAGGRPGAGKPLKFLIYLDIYIYTFIQIFIHRYMYVCIVVHKCGYLNVYICVYTHVYIHAYIYTVHVYIYIYIYVHTYIHI